MTKSCDVRYDDSCTRFLENAARYKRHPHKKEQQIGQEYRVGYYSTFSSFKPKSNYITHNHKHFAFSDALGLINERPTLSHHPTYSPIDSPLTARTGASSYSKSSRRSTNSDRSVRHLGNLFDAMQEHGLLQREEKRQQVQTSRRNKENECDLFNPQEQVVNQIAAFEKRLKEMKEDPNEIEELIEEL
jgi:outer membrane usher protein FimD/PapC